MVLEAGYIGRKISNEFQEVNIDAIPWMTTLGGETFAQAYAQMYTQYCGLSGPNCAANPVSSITAQPFIENALGGAGSAFCAGFSNCTQAVIKNYGASIKATQVYSLWQSLQNTAGWTLGRTLFSSPALGGVNINPQLSAFELNSSTGYGNYNAAFVKFTTKDWHGLTNLSNFTWSRALGTGSVVQASSSVTTLNPWNYNYAYGPQPFDVKFVYSQMILYQPPVFKDQKGIVGRALGGWTIAPLFTAQSGFPMQINVGTGSNVNAQAFGEVYGNNNSGNYENAIGVSAFTGGNSAHNNVQVAGTCAGTSGNSGMNMFANPCAVYNEFRPPILGIDTNENGAGTIRGFPTWNLDLTVTKDIRGTERFGAQLIFQFVNVLNHFQPANPGGAAGSALTSSSISVSNPTTFGVITNQAASANGALSRWMEFGLRIHF
jgi:hypothetical protein